MSRTIKVKMQGITKTFNTVIANDNVDLEVYEGEIHALLGENGAGKSTLMNMLAGIYRPDKGNIYINGQDTVISSPIDAIKNGIGMIHQHFKLIETFTAMDNIIAGTKGHSFLNTKAISIEIKKLCEQYGMDIDPYKRVYDMSVGEKQAVEILKVLYRNLRVLIMDEPTATLTPQEIKKLFTVIRKMRDNGCSIIIITHKMQEVMDISDRVTVLRGGQSVAVFNTNEVAPKLLIEHMVGRSVSLEITRAKAEITPAVLEVNGLTVKGSDNTLALQNINFSLSGGEILGIAGVAGSGQKELCEAIAGLYNIEAGDIRYKNSSIIGKSPKDIFKMGISMSFIPEDRLGMGLAGSLDLVDNVILRSYNNNKGILINRRPARQKAQDIVNKLEVKTPSVNHPVRLLSGGNIQKVLLGREIDCSPHVLITAYPTRGLDIGVTHVIYDILNDQKEKGVAIIYVGEDLDVLLALTDRILVLNEGKQAGIVNSNETTKEELGLMMSGGVA